jgi:citrate synthase
MPAVPLTPWTPWWRTESLTEPEAVLLFRVHEAHADSARRDNISSVMLRSAYAGSGSFTGAIAGALLTLGGMHAPLEQTVELLERERPELEAWQMLERGEFVPGWGNSFHRGTPDPIWTGVDACLREHFKPLAARLDAVSQMMLNKRKGLVLLPNASAFTAAAAIAVGIPARAAAWLFISGRLDAWAKSLMMSSIY